MIHYSIQQIEKLDKLFRINLINSCTGYKSANLIATKSGDGIENVAVFSSVTHLGSSPPLLSFILRPTTVERNTYSNIKKTKFFTVNHVTQDIIEDAHHTSAKYPGTISEFDKTNLSPIYLDGFYAPYVLQSSIKIGCSFENEYFIKENNCLFIIGAIEHIYFDEKIHKKDGFLNLEEAKTVAVNGLDGYALPKLLNRLEYARPKD